MPGCVLSLWIYLFRIFHIHGTVQYMTFCAWLLPHCKTVLKIPSDILTPLYFCSGAGMSLPTENTSKRPLRRVQGHRQCYRCWELPRTWCEMPSQTPERTRGNFERGKRNVKVIPRAPCDQAEKEPRRFRTWGQIQRDIDRYTDNFKY